MFQTCCLMTSMSLTIDSAICDSMQIFLWDSSAGRVASLLLSCLRRHAAMRDIWQQQVWCKTHRDRIHHLWGAVSEVAWGGEEILAFSWIWGEQSFSCPHPSVSEYTGILYIANISPNSVDLSVESSSRIICSKVQCHKFPLTWCPQFNQ